MGPTARPSASCPLPAGIALIAMLLAPPAAIPAAAQAPDQMVGRTVAWVRVLVEGAGPLAVQGEAALAALAEVRAGAPLALADVRESITHLMALERFADVTVSAEPDGERVGVRFVATPIRRIGRVRFTGAGGASGVSDRALGRAVAERFGSLPPATRAPAIARLVEEAFASRGYLRPAATATLQPAPRADRADLLVEVTPGARVRIGSVEVTTTPELAPAAIRQRLGLTERAPFDRVEFDRRVANLAADLRQGSRLEARVAADIRPAAGGETVDIRVAASRGPRVLVEFRGDAPPADRQAELVPVAREASVDQDLLEDGTRAIENYYRGLGYRDARADYTREQSGATLRIVFSASRGSLYRLGDVRVAAEEGSSLTELPPPVTLRRGDLLLESRLEAEVGRIAEDYRRRGFGEVRAKPEIAVAPGARPGESTANLTIRIGEGPRRIIDTVAFEGAEAVAASRLARLVQSSAGSPYYQRRVDDDRDAILTRYADLGYQGATVEPRATDLAGGLVRLTFAVREGPQVRVDHVLVVGNSRIATPTIERQITIRRGDPLSLSALVETRRRLAALGLFRQIRVTEIARGAPTRRDVLVAVDEASATTIGYGLGLEGRNRVFHGGDAGTTATEGPEIVPRGFFEVGRRNLWGKNRSVNLFTRASVRRKDAPVDTDPATTGGGFDFRDYRVLASYREPAIAGINTDGVVTAFLEQAIRTSYTYNRRGVAAELVHRVGRRTSISARYSLDLNRVYEQRLSESERLLVDRLFPQVRLSSVSSSLVRDTRDDAIDPGSGTLLLADGEVAAQRIGSRVGFARTYLQGYGFKRIPASRRLVLAGAARVGLSVGFAREAASVDAEGNPVIGPDGRPVMVRVKDVPASRRFFAGGDTTHRAFAIDRLGSSETLGSDGDPKGGRALVLLNGELRVGLTSWLSAVGFVDLGNVFAGVGDIDVGRLRGGVGGGVRLRTPLGPIRVDVGVKTSRQHFGSGALEPGYSWQLGFGQAF